MTKLQLSSQTIPRACSSFTLIVVTVALLHLTSLSLAANETTSEIATSTGPSLVSNVTTDNDTGDEESHREHGNKTHGEDHSSGGHHSEGLVVASWNYHEVRDPLIFTIILVMAAVCKIVYHHAGFLSSIVPESCILIILGIIFGALIFFTGAQKTLPTFFEPHEFFIFLLPPIILEASFSLHDRTFIENLGSILLFAVVGTILACVFVGLSLFGLAKSGAMGTIEELGFIELMVFSSLIVAVDPVAVLAVFNEIGVNQVLYFLVFGESLLNDGVTVVLYKVFQAYNVMDEITGVHIVVGIVKFFVVCLGGLFLGILSGLLSALLTKKATHVKVAQPLIIYTMAYLGFLCAELFEFSGIICLVGCGITQKHYAFTNISDKSKTTINYFTKVISTACETIIFMFLGMALVNDKHDWHTGFTLWTVLLCNVYRFMITFGLSFLINKLDTSRVRKITMDEQFMIAYGGLRGAVCFSLVALLHPDDFQFKDMFVTTTLAVIIFTVFIQGATIKPLVKLFQIKLAPEKQMSMYKELQEHVTDHLMAGIEDIIGDHGKNHLREKMQYWDVKYLQPLLLVAPDPCDAQLKEFYQHLIMKEHYNHMKASNVKAVEQMPELPHITTELFLKGLLTPPTLDGVGEIPSVVVDEPQSPGVGSFYGEEEIILRQRSSSSRSPHELTPERSDKRSMSSPEVTNPSQLRTLLRQNSMNSRFTRHDRNLTEAQDFQSQFRKKTDQNQRLRRLSNLEGLNPRLASQLSWCEANASATAERTGEKHPGPRHAATMDMQNYGRQGTVEPINGHALSAPSSPLGRVREEKEALVYKTKSLSSDDNDGYSSSSSGGGDENQQMIEGEGEEERRIRLMKRKGRRSTKHRLERQGGMDTQLSEPVGVTGVIGQGQQQAVPMEDLGKGGQGGSGSGSGDLVVKVDIEDDGDDSTTKL